MSSAASAPPGTSRTRTWLEPGAVPGTAVVVFEGAAIPGTLAAYAGVLTLAGLDILSATVMKRGDVVHDTFEVRVPSRSGLSETVVAELARQADAVLEGRSTLDSALRARRNFFSAVAFTAEVEVDLSSEITTGFRVRAADRPGLLHDLASALSSAGLRTRSVSVLTIAGVARDTFRVVDASGLPPRDAETIERVRQALLRAAND